MKLISRRGAIATSEAAILFLSVVTAAMLMSGLIWRSVRGLAGNLEAGAAVTTINRPPK